MRRWRRGAICLLALAAAAACDRREPVARDAGLFEIPQIPLEELPEAVRQEIVDAQEAVRRSPASPEAVGALGVAYFGHVFPAAAAACFERAAQLEPGEMRWTYFAALSYGRDQDDARAIDALERTIALDDGYAAAYVNLADRIIEADPDRAAALYGRALELDERQARAHFGLGQCARISGRGDDALEHFGRAAELVPKYGAAQYQLAMLLRESGRLDEAAEHLRLYQEGWGPPTYGDPLEAQLMDRLRVPLVIERRAAGLAGTGRADEAIALLKSALEDDPQRSLLRMRLGAIELESGRPDEAVEEFRAVLDYDPSQIAAYTNLADALGAMGRPDEAEHVLREALDLHPDDGLILHQLGLLLARRGANSEAIGLLRRAEVIRPGDAGLRADLGGFLAQAGEAAEATEHLEAAIRLNPRLGPPYLHLANLAVAAGDCEAAERRLRTGLSSVPDARYLRARLTRVERDCSN